MVKELAGAGNRLRAALDVALPREQARKELLAVRLSPDELAAIKAEAESRGVPLATFARVLLVEALGLLREGR